MPTDARSLPQHDEMGYWWRCAEIACLTAAAALILLNALRFIATPDVIDWYMPITVIAGAVLADFMSGIVHWIADTWGSETMPVFGHRFLKPFRVHHINPNDLLRRNFVDTNGDVAMGTLPFQLSAFFLPLENDFGAHLAVFSYAFAICMLPTNQVHKWAHSERPPAFVRWLQRKGLILSREQHETHHTAPYAMNYCITTGWCNDLLTALRFFPAMEWMISRLTGAKPRGEDLVLTAEHGVGSPKESGVAAVENT